MPIKDHPEYHVNKNGFLGFFFNIDVCHIISIADEMETMGMMQWEYRNGIWGNLIKVVRNLN